ncbi:Formate-dependent nitrite reductase complex subunit NrfG [Rhodocyclaceae bacterium]|nr:Formate-dependent nitrite reductase complex subunit NrfG [Rhodocyclaceae bacterium]
MTTFLIIAVLLIAIALLFILPTLLGRSRRDGSSSRSEANLSIYRDQLRELDADLAAGTLNQEQYQEARNELESRLLEDSSASEEEATPSSGRWMIIAALITVPALTISLYWLLGKPEGLKPHLQTAEVGQSQGATQAQIEAMVSGLEQKLKAQPNDAKGWAMLGNSYGVLGRFNASAAAYGRAAALAPDNAQLLADYADVLAMAQGKNFQGEPEAIIQQALKADPANIKALALAGSAAFQRKDYNAAINYWQNLVKLLPADSDFLRSVNGSITQAQKLAGLTPAGAEGATSQVQNQPASGNATVSGTVNLDPGFRARVADTDTVFVFARDAAVLHGPPLATLRKTVKDLPLTFTMDDSMAIMPNMKLSSASRVVVGARISKAGNATTRPGDMEGLSQPVKIGASGIAIKIDTEVK